MSLKRTNFDQNGEVRIKRVLKFGIGTVKCSKNAALLSLLSKTQIRFKF